MADTEPYEFPALLVMKDQFKVSASLYADAEIKWRSRAFKVAVLLGAVPICNGVTQLIPEFLRPWLTLMLSITNVFIVVVNVKMDMGERIADASMAGKGYAKMASDIDYFFVSLKCSSQANKPDCDTLMVKMQTIQETIDTNLSYPEAEPKPKPEKRSRSAVLPYAVSEASNNDDEGNSKSVSSSQRSMPFPQAVSREKAAAGSGAPASETDFRGIMPGWSAPTSGEGSGAPPSTSAPVAAAATTLGAPAAAEAFSQSTQVGIERLVVAGAEAVQPNFMGVFSRSGIVPTDAHQGRPIYDNTNGNHLYFWAATGNWIISDNGGYKSGNGYICSLSDVDSPVEASGWKVWDGKEWSSAYLISVVKDAEQASLTRAAHVPETGFAPTPSALERALPTDVEAGN